VTRIVVRPAAKPLTGSVPVPSDKSIGQRALVFAALSGGPSVLRGFAYGEGSVATLRAFQSMGVSVEDDGRGTLKVHGRGLSGLGAPPADIDCGNSATAMRLLAGILAAQPFRSRLVADASLSRRRMAGIARPLRARGASVEGAVDATQRDEITAPLVIGPLARGQRLTGLEYRIPEVSSQVKGALLLSGLFASGPTLVYEPLLSRDHTERMLAALGAPIRAAGTMVSLEPPERPDLIAPFDLDLPGDLSAAAFLLGAALIVEGSVVTTRRTGLNPTRAGILDVIRAFGGTFAAENAGDVLGEPFGLATARHSELRATKVGGELATRSIDEIPLACALAARARGETRFSDIGELRVPESDGIARLVALLRSFGVEAEEQEEGIAVVGRPEQPLRAARVESHGDHRIAMTACVLGLVADGETVVHDADCIATSFPRFVGTLRALGADLEVAA
jgi:3-phosphoshikimate 1-carboxyvinyltransferase